MAMNETKLEDGSSPKKKINGADKMDINERPCLMFKKCEEDGSIGSKSDRREDGLELIGSFNKGPLEISSQRITKGVREPDDLDTLTKNGGEVSGGGIKVMEFENSMEAMGV